jgi:hypothetical protein
MIVSIVVALATLAALVYVLVVWPAAALHAIVRWWRDRRAGRRPPSQML